MRLKISRFEFNSRRSQLSLGLKTSMKKVPCSYEKCGDYRCHWEKPEEKRGTQMIEVEDDFDKPAYCSITCATLAGALGLKDVEAHDERIQS